MTFATAAIAGQPLPTAENATYIWAMNNEDSYVGYYGRSNGNRGKLEIDWSVGIVEAEPEPEMGRYLEVGAQCAPGMCACAPPSSCLCNGAARSARAPSRVDADVRLRVEATRTRSGRRGSTTVLITSLSKYEQCTTATGLGRAGGRVARWEAREIVRTQYRTTLTVTEITYRNKGVLLRPSGRG